MNCSHRDSCQVESLAFVMFIFFLSFLLNRLQCNRIDSLSVLVLAVLVDGLRIPFDEARKGLKP